MLVVVVLAKEDELVLGVSLEIRKYARFLCSVFPEAVFKQVKRPRVGI